MEAEKERYAYGIMVPLRRGTQPGLHREHHGRLLGGGDPCQSLKDEQELSRGKEGKGHN